LDGRRTPEARLRRPRDDPQRRQETRVRRAIATRVHAGDRFSIFLADLTADDGWDAAVDGCASVLHVASPRVGGRGVDFVATAPKTPSWTAAKA
jgi:hypothetical protein